MTVRHHVARRTRHARKKTARHKAKAHHLKKARKTPVAKSLKLRRGTAYL